MEKRCSSFFWIALWSADRWETWNMVLSPRIFIETLKLDDMQLAYNQFHFFLTCVFRIQCRAKIRKPCSIKIIPRSLVFTIDLSYMKIHIFALWWRDEIKRSSQLRALLKRVVVNRTWKIPVQRSTNWANTPTGSWSMNWVQINIQVKYLIKISKKGGNLHMS